MNKKIDIIIANPAGNTTIIVITPTPRSEYQDTANRLLDMEFGGEQVEFLLKAENDKLPSMEMCGLEFCGNASRAFAFYRVAKFCDGELLNDGRRKLKINVSGCDYPLTAIVDVENNDAQIQMPVPVDIEYIDGNTLIDLGGISHLILYDEAASKEKFDVLKNKVYEIHPEMEAFGVMFIDTVADTMTPVVFVRDVGTTYFEGSCASGTTAASCARSLSESSQDGIFHYKFQQPSGTLFTKVSKSDGKITDIQLNGLMELSEIIAVKI